jgi:type IV pilus assembly protein PilV
MGLLGVGALQTKGLQSSNDAYFLTQASFLAESMAERIRANHSDADPASAAYTSVTHMTDYHSAPTVETSCDTATCTQSEMAVYDTHAWLADIDQLPAGKASINWSGTTATIIVRWQPRIGGEGNCDASGDFAATNPTFRCYKLVTTF